MGATAPDINLSASTHEATRHPAASDTAPRQFITSALVKPEQFQDLWNGTTTSPERELAAAVLEMAAADLHKHRYSRGRHDQQLYWRAYDWVASENQNWPFSFVNLCELLHLSPEALRASLLRVPAHDPVVGPTRSAPGRRAVVRTPDRDARAPVGSASSASGG
jgi:hypothetical protein